MNELQIFKSEQFGEIRWIKSGGKDFAVGNDIAKSLGYAIPSKAINTHCKGVSKMEVPTNGGVQEMLVITEGDIYRLVAHSKLPAAEKFESWIFDEVLPQIRKTGGYIPIEKNMSEAEIMAKALIIAQSTIAKKDELISNQTKQLEEQKPKVDFVDHISTSENSLLVREVAKIASKKGIKIGERKLYEKLRSWKMVFKNTCEATQKAIDQGILEIVEGAKENSKGTFTFKTTKVTGKGQVYIINRLIEEGF